MNRPDAPAPASPPGHSPPVASLRGVGPALAERLQRLGIHSVQDLLLHLPLRYEDRTRTVSIAAAGVDDAVTIEADVLAARVVLAGRRQLQVTVADGSAVATLRFFHFGRAQQDRYVTGGRVRCFGRARLARSGVEMVHPEILVVPPGQALPPLGDCLTPVYPVTEGIAQNRMRALIRAALARVDAVQELPVAAQVLGALGIAEPFGRALDTVHSPPADVDRAALAELRHPAQVRLVVEELLAHQLAQQRLRELRADRHGWALPGPPTVDADLRAALGFALTGAQQRVCAEVLADLARPRPSHRLVQGDVGSGKTVVAAAAAVRAARTGAQCALMAPTELLAEQHERNLRRWLEPLGIAVGLLTGTQPARERRATRQRLATGDLAVVVGTHALYQADVEFARLALVIIDEQHRFGVHQRLLLKAKSDRSGIEPHRLVLTATPIPRTLAMSLYADLDVSVIDQLPAGRQPITTLVISADRRDEVITAVARAIAEHRQVYWVCTAIEASDVVPAAEQAQAAEDTRDRLAGELPGARIGLVHGRLKPGEKHATMAAFEAGALDLLVATTVIEVGVDVPNASVMVIDNAERLGLAQLHQLRGRVGRGRVASHCLLLYEPPLSRTARARLEVLRRSQDGFEIAETDLSIRGPGDFLGTRQTGLAQFRIADLVRDHAWMAPIAAQAARVAAGPAEVDALIARWIPADGAYSDV